MLTFIQSTIFLSLATMASTQMVVFDTSNNFDIRCGPDSYCLLSGSHSVLYVGPTDPKEIERDGRYEDKGLDGYHFLKTGAFIQGIECTTSEADGSCTATCDATCVCLFGETNPNNQFVNNCTILEELPNSNVPNPSELVIYESSAQLPDERMQIRCQEYLAICTPMVAKDGSYFVYQTGIYNSEVYYMFRDYSDCKISDDDPASACYMACDPKCECTEEVNNETATCLIKPPTESPTITPSMAPTMVSSAIVTKSVAALAMAAVYGCIVVF